MKKLIVLTAWMIMAISSYSQIGFPRIIKYGSDSVVAITFEQMKKINITKIERDSYKQIADSLKVEVDLYEYESKIGINMLQNLQKQVSLQDSLLKKDREIELILQNDNNFLKKKIKKEKTLKTIVYILGSGIITSLTAMTLYFGVK